MDDIINRRRALSLIAALSAAALALPACSEQDSGNSAADTAEAVNAAAAPQPAGTVDMDSVLQPGPLPEMVMGKADAPVTIVEYASMTCGHCANFHNNTLPAIKENYIDTGKARLILREFPFDPRAEAGFMLARCSDDKYFAMVDVLFKQQNNWAAAPNARDALLQLAKLGGFTQQSFEACLTDQELLEDIREVRGRAASEFAVDSTPTFFINGKVYKGALTVEEMSAIIDSMLASAGVL
jgi:protein-disulfide isomerase